MADHNNFDIDPIETREWLQALDNVITHDGSDRVHFLLKQLAERAGESGASIAMSNRDYINTIPVSQQPAYPGNLKVESRLQKAIRWNAVAMVLRGAHTDPSLGGHLASYASSATLYEVGFNHHFKAADKNGQGGDLVYIQGHTSPGIYARAFLEGRITEKQLANFRQDLIGGVCSYPHPRSMPDFWQFATVSMGLGPLQAIYQAKFLKYLHNHELADTRQRKVWAFLGDGEMDEPESLGAIGIARDAQLDNLIFVVNCNLQRLDGPVRGNGSIVRDLEGIFTGADWNVIKVIWSSDWDPLFAKDQSGKLIQRMNECLDGDYQSFKAHGGAFVRKEFFGKYPETADLVAEMSDEEIFNLRRGGHDPVKVHAAYAKAEGMNNGKPTVILAHTVKGFSLLSVEANNNAHNIKKLSDEELRKLRDRWDIPFTDKELETVPFYKPKKDSEEMQYLFTQREKLSGFLPARRVKTTEKLKVPALSAFDAVLKGSDGREISSNMALVRVLTTLYKDKNLTSRVVTVIPDESRTLGLEGLFRQVGIYSPVGQLYTPVDSGQLVYYKEDKKGRIIQEGINEAGAFCSWMAAGTSYSTSNTTMIPFYFYYSMFGFQRIGDLAWAAGDICTRGFLIGGLSGRTTLAGEGLQHADGHSHVLAGTIPCAVTYDPTYGYEIAVIIQEGLRRMVEKQENIFYYITMMNENYVQPAMPKGVEDGIIKGLYLLQASKAKTKKLRVQLLGSGSILREVEAAAKMLADDFEVNADVWSATSFNELYREALAIERHNWLHPEEKVQQSYVTECLVKQSGPIVVATDYIREYAEKIRRFLPGKSYTVLGTDGFGHSDTRERLRDFFEVDRRYICLAAITALVAEGELPKATIKKVIKQYKINVDKIDPMDV